MAIEADILYRDRDTIIDELLSALLARIPDAYVAEDGVIRILMEVFAESLEGMYLANQILRDNLFISTASQAEVVRYGEQYGLPFKTGSFAAGTLLFTGAGGTFIPAGTEVGADLGTGDINYYETTADATIPNPGIPTAPTAADGGAGALAAGTYEWAVTFVTAQGETAIGAESTPLVLGASKQANLTSIPVGGPGTVSRRIYRSVDGGDYALVTTIANNTATTYTDNTATGSLGAAPPDASTAERVAVAGQAQEAGADKNAVIGTILEVIEAPDGVATVTNSTSFTGGTDPEDIESFRSRLLDFVRNPQTGSVSDLEFWAEEIDGVEQAVAFSNDNLGTPTAGHATVRIIGPDGSTPDSDVQAAVLAHLESKDIANITLHVGVFTPVSTDVTVDVTTEAGYSLGDVTDEVEAAITSYINGLGVGKTAYIAGIIDAVFGNVNGVATLSVTTPASDQTTTASQKRVIGTVSVT